jgi:hypothetical protein
MTKIKMTRRQGRAVKKKWERAQMRPGIRKTAGNRQGTKRFSQQNAIKKLKNSSKNKIQRPG